MDKQNCIVAQSGGPTVAINASLAGVMDGVIKSEAYDTIFGSQYGILGILKSEIIDLSALCKKNPNMIDVLKITPAMYLGSCRYKLPAYQEDEEPYVRIFHKFKELNIGAFFYIGGNDSMDTVLKLSHYAKKIKSDIRMIGIPKTIDNDLCVTDHTPGFGSAAKYVATSVLEIAHDTFIYSIKSVTIIEIMGRDSGWLTAASALARNDYSSAPHLIYLPEVPFEKEQFIKDVSELLNRRNNVVIAVSEGIQDQDGNYISATVACDDQFGHSQLSGTGKYLERLIQEKINVKVRSIELNVLQRCGAHLASQTDLEEAYALGVGAVRYAEEGQNECMLTMKRISDSPYEIQIDSARIDSIANKVKAIPLDWICESKNNVKQELMDYISPLIIGEPSIPYQKGLPAYHSVEHLE